MNEAETRAELVDPALREAGWGVVEGSRIRREHITLGRLQGAGKRAKPEIADYVLMVRGQKLGVIEAKKRDTAVTEGLGQAKAYAAKLLARFAYSTNGRGIYQVDMQTGAEGEIAQYPTPDELWQRVYAEANDWRDRFAAVPFHEKGGTYPIRYYQYNAATRALEAIANGRDRILLTLATGTGKTRIAFQIAWKLFESRWNLSREPTRRPRILFLADRNILADQAYNEFSDFPEDALARITPADIRKKGRVPKNASIFFTIFQTFMTGTDHLGNRQYNYGQYPPDFFDFIIVDECHRGGANDESEWRDILEHFAPAVQLGLTATPKRTENVDTYAYFGEPLYTYSLKEGINDGFLTPFKVRAVATTVDEYVYTPDDTVVQGMAEEGRRYREKDFNRIIEIAERERYRVQTFMEMIDQREKTLVFCASQDHALAVRDLINQIKTSSADPDYCVRVTAKDGKRGERFLEQFKDSEKTIPTILTTSHKLSTGVDARNIRNIVLMRPINSMIEFKQIIGRGTRLFEGKDYFTIIDFVKAYEHFNDPEWDGEPLAPEQPRPKKPKSGEEEVPVGTPANDDEERERPQTLKIKLADGKERTIRHISATSFWSPDGKPISAAQFIESLFGQLPQLFKDEAELRALWGRPDTRKALLNALEERGFGGEQLKEITRVVDAENSDLFDVLAYIAYSRALVTRAERVATHRPQILAHYEPKLQEFLDFVLGQYVGHGVSELDQEKLASLLELKYHTVNDAADQLGGTGTIRDAFVNFQAYLYAP
ncbi:MAG: DEAD/DEAH box helicase family protein [Alphaproteobacteria bacterium]|nr:DEAD/DEAH box helicase family protein [Alphaproteobacteria bacterium]